MAVRAASSSTSDGPPNKRIKLEDAARDELAGSEDEVEDADADAGINLDVFSDAEQLFKPENIAAMHAAFTGQDSGNVKILDDATITREPFPALQLRNVFAEKVIAGARKQLTGKTTYSHKENDLYSYHGSGDLSDPEIGPEGSDLATLRDTLYSSEFTSLITAITGVPLFAGRPDLSSHRYYNGDHLLAHDDDIRGEEGMEDEGRRIAFILYLVDPKWSREDGGSLDLYQCNSLGHPTAVTQSIYPVWNSIALFEVTPTSYHTVAEVTLSASLAASQSPYRLSISGWFHGPTTSRLALPVSTSIFTSQSSIPPSAEDFVNPTYFDPTTQKTIEASLISDSSIELRGFLKASLYEKLTEEIAASSYDLSQSSVVGPAHIRQYYRLHGTPILDSVIAFFKSPDFLALLTAFTSLDFLPQETRGRVGGRLFKRGCYTLLHDEAHDPDGVEIILGIGNKRLSLGGDSQSPAKANGKGKAKANGVSHTSEELSEEAKVNLEELGWTSGWGGTICYTRSGAGREESPEEKAKKEADDEGADEDDPSGSLFVLPRPNALTVVIRNQATVKFVKYINGKARDQVDGTPLARLDIEGIYAVDLDGDDDEVEGELVTDESDQESEDNEVEHEEWTGFDKKKATSVEPDEPDELDD